MKCLSFCSVSPLCFVGNPALQGRADLRGRPLIILGEGGRGNRKKKEKNFKALFQQESKNFKGPFPRKHWKGLLQEKKIWKGLSEEREKIGEAMARKK